MQDLRLNYTESWQVFGKKLLTYGYAVGFKVCSFRKPEFLWHIGKIIKTRWKFTALQIVRAVK